MRVNKSYLLIAVVIFMSVAGIGCGNSKANQPVTLTDTSTGLEYLSGSFSYDREERNYLLYLPDSYTDEAELPLVVFLHSYGWNAETEMRNTKFNKVANDYGFVIVYPDSIGEWNSGVGDNPQWPTPETDDVAYIKALITELHDLYHINLDRVYATGYSNGGFMSYRLACEASDQFPAIASVGGTMSNGVYENCKPSRAISVLEIHGTRDGFVNYDGNDYWKSVDETVDYWVKVNECKTTDNQVLEDIDPEDSGIIEKTSYSDCNGSSTVVLMKVENGGHTWPGEDMSSYGYVNKDIDASEEIWKFFSSH